MIVIGKIEFTLTKKVETIEEAEKLMEQTVEEFMTEQREAGNLPATIKSSPDRWEETYFPKQDGCEVKIVSRVSIEKGSL